MPSTIVTVLPATGPPVICGAEVIVGANRLAATVSLPNAVSLPSAFDASTVHATVWPSALSGTSYVHGPVPVASPSTSTPSSVKAVSAVTCAGTPVVLSTVIVSVRPLRLALAVIVGAIVAPPPVTVTVHPRERSVSIAAAPVADGAEPPD